MNSSNHRVAIITHPLQYNYGGVLQAFALNTVLSRYCKEVVVLRNDEALQKNAHKLVLALQPSKDFELGEQKKLFKTIVISDKLERPTRWKEDSWEVQTYLGAWSETKHRLLIDVTGQKWDNDFLYYMLYDFDAELERDYYLTKTKKFLAEYNANPANNPPLKDENGKEVVFP